MVDLITQLRYFKAVEKKLRRKLGAERSKALISSAVYLLSIGGNDYLSPFTFNSSFYDKFSNQEYVAMVFGNMTQFIQVLKYYNYNLFINTLELQLFKYLILIGWCVCWWIWFQGMYKIGARKFGFVTLPPLGCLPGTKILVPGNTGACFKEATQLTKMHNDRLPIFLKLIQTRLQGFKYSLHDLHTSMTQRLESPSKYGNIFSLLYINRKLTLSLTGFKQIIVL